MWKLQASLFSFNEEHRSRQNWFFEVQHIIGPFHCFAFFAQEEEEEAEEDEVYMDLEALKNQSSVSCMKLFLFSQHVGISGKIR